MLDAPSPVARAVNALLTRQCVIFTIVMTWHTHDPQDTVEPLQAWFSAAAHDHQQDLVDMIEGFVSVE